MSSKHKFEFAGYSTQDGVTYRVYKCGCGAQRLVSANR